MAAYAQGKSVRDPLGGGVGVDVGGGGFGGVIGGFGGHGGGSVGVGGRRCGDASGDIGVMC